MHERENLTCSLLQRQQNVVNVLLCSKRSVFLWCGVKIHDTSPSRPNKLLPLKIDCYTQNQSSEHSKTHQASRKPIRTKTNMWSCKLSLCHPPSWPLLQFETLLDDWTNKSHHFWVFGVGGGRLVIISLSCYSMSQQGARGVGLGGRDEERRGWWAFAENIIGMASVTLSISLRFASLCAVTEAPAMFH